MGRFFSHATGSKQVSVPTETTQFFICYYFEGFFPFKIIQKNHLPSAGNLYFPLSGMWFIVFPATLKSRSIYS